MATIKEITQKLRSLKLSNLIEEAPKILSLAEQGEWSYIQMLDEVLTREIDARNANRIEQNKRKSNIEDIKTIEEFDFKFQTTISKKEVNSLLDFQFIENRENIIFIGASSLGKTHLATGIGLKALEKGYKVLFIDALTLEETLTLAQTKGKLKAKINQLLKFDMIILDELGYLPMGKSSMYNLFQLIHAMYEYRSLIITSNKEFTNWNEFFHNDNVAVPIIDRIVHHSKIFILGGESYRLRGKLKK